MKAPSNGFSSNIMDGDKKSINSELWHACAGPLVSLPPVGSLVVYFPQGHSEQVAASMQKDTDSIPGYPSLPSKLICMLDSVSMHADPETDEVYAKMTLLPVNKYDKDALLASDMGLKQSKQPAEFFCKTLTASDTSTHGGFSVPRRAAEKSFPPLVFSFSLSLLSTCTAISLIRMLPNSKFSLAMRFAGFHNATTSAGAGCQRFAQCNLEISARLQRCRPYFHFLYLKACQPKRHLLTTGWSVFVSTKRLLAGDSVLFIRDKKSQLLLGVRHANRQQPTLSSSVLSSDSMHIGVLAAASHAAANNSPFTIFYNPRACLSEFVIPLAKYQKAMYMQVSLGMRFRMMFETEESGIRRYMGTITGISDLDPIRWKNSQWRNLQVGWDESTAGERRNRVSLWEIEPVVTPFYLCPPYFRPKFIGQPGLADDGSEIENVFRRAIPWLSDNTGTRDAQNSIFPGLSLIQWMSIQQQRQQQQQENYHSGCIPAVLASSLANNIKSGDASLMLNFQTDAYLPLSNSQFSTAKLNQQSPSNQLAQPPLTWSHRSQQPQLHQHPPSQQQQRQAQLTAVNVSVIEQNQQSQQQVQLQQHNHQQQQQVTQSLAQTQHQTQILQQHMAPMLSLQQNLVTPTLQFQQNHQQQNHVTMPPKSVQPQGEQHQHILPQSSQQQQLQVTQHQLQLHLVQNLQHQQPMLSQASTQVPSQLAPHHLQNGKMQHQQQIIGTSFSQSPLSQTPEIAPNPVLRHAKLPSLVGSSSAATNTEVHSYVSPSTANCNMTSVRSPNTRQHGPSVMMQDKKMVPESSSNLIQNTQSKSNIQVKQELPALKEADHLAYHGSAVTDQLDAVSSASLCVDGNNQGSFSPLGFDGENTMDGRNNLLFGVAMDGMAPDTLLSGGFGSEKDLQNFLSSYDKKEIETELSMVGISSQSFAVGDMSFDPGYSTEPIADENGHLNRSMLSNQQPQRLRTFTKVYKRGSVGRSIDVTRYRGYEELRHDLACMFGIEGQLNDPRRTDWKLVYVDHENDILLVGDDPWEEFVGCVQSIKILSSAEVQQLSLDGDLVNLSMPNQTCSG